MPKGFYTRKKKEKESEFGFREAVMVFKGEKISLDKIKGGMLIGKPVCLECLTDDEVEADCFLDFRIVEGRMYSCERCKKEF